MNVNSAGPTQTSCEHSHEAETTKPKPRRGRPPLPRVAGLHSDTYKFRCDPTVGLTGLEQAWAQLRLLDIAFTPWGGRVRMGVITGYAPRYVNKWFVDKMLPPRAATIFSLCRELVALGYDKRKAVPSVAVWPEGLELAQFLPVGTPGLLDPTFRQWLEDYAPTAYANAYCVGAAAAAAASLVYKPPKFIDLETAWCAQQRIATLLSENRLHEHTVADYYAAKFYNHTITEEEVIASQTRAVGRPRRCDTTADGTGADNTDALQERIERAAEENRLKAWEAMPDDYIAPVEQHIASERGPLIVDTLEDMAKAWGTRLTTNE